MATRDEIQEPLEAMMKQKPYSEYFAAPEGQAVGEFRLKWDVGKRPFRADAHYELISGGDLFIEHDNAATGLNNLVKYWYLLKEGCLKRPIHLVHIIDDKRPAAAELCRFAGERIEADVKGFSYYLHKVSDWHNAEWQDCLSGALAEIMATPS